MASSLNGGTRSTAVAGATTMSFYGGASRVLLMLVKKTQRVFSGEGMVMTPALRPVT